MVDRGPSPASSFHQAPSSPPDQAPLSTCFGGGGAYGFGFNMGVADGLNDAGVPVSHFSMLGTSAGSMTAAALAIGLGFDEAADIWASCLVPTRRRVGWEIADLMEPLFGSSRPPVDIVTGVAVQVRNFRRSLLNGHTYRLADITAASSAVAPVARPHRIDGRRYIDGGFRSMASADLAAPASQLLLITPFSHPAQGPPGRLGQHQAQREMRKWIVKSGGAVVHVRPTEAMARLSSNRLGDVGDIEIGRRVYPLARELGREIGGLLPPIRPTI